MTCSSCTREFKRCEEDCWVCDECANQCDVCYFGDPE